MCVRTCLCVWSRQPGMVSDQSSVEMFPFPLSRVLIYISTYIFRVGASLLLPALCLGSNVQVRKKSEKISFLFFYQGSEQLQSNQYGSGHSLVFSVICQWVKILWSVLLKNFIFTYQNLMILTVSLFIPYTNVKLYLYFIPMWNFVIFPTQFWTQSKCDVYMYRFLQLIWPCFTFCCHCCWWCRLLPWFSVPFPIPRLYAFIWETLRSATTLRQDGITLQWL